VAVSRFEISEKEKHLSGALGKALLRSPLSTRTHSGFKKSEKISNLKRQLKSSPFNGRMMLWL